MNKINRLLTKANSMNRQDSLINVLMATDNELEHSIRYSTTKENVHLIFDTSREMRTSIEELKDMQNKPIVVIIDNLPRTKVFTQMVDAQRPLCETGKIEMNDADPYVGLTKSEMAYVRRMKQLGAAEQNEIYTDEPLSMYDDPEKAQLFRYE